MLKLMHMFKGARHISYTIRHNPTTDSKKRCPISYQNVKIFIKFQDRAVEKPYFLALPSQVYLNSLYVEISTRAHCRTWLRCRVGNWGATCYLFRNHNSNWDFYSLLQAGSLFSDNYEEGAKVLTGKNWFDSLNPLFAQISTKVL